MENKRTGIKKLEATAMDALRRAARTSRLERIRNETINQEMGVQKTTIDCIEEKQLIWYGHVRRMGQDRLPKKTMRWIPRGQRKKGRPKKTWIEGIRRSMRNRGR